MKNADTDPTSMACAPKGNEKVGGASPRSSLSEKSFLRSITISLMCIVFCIVALSSTTWAWFTETSSSDENVVRSATCDVQVWICAPSEDPLLLGDGEDFTFLRDLPYTVSISAAGSARSAYCIFLWEDQKYYTEQIAIATDAEPLTFTLTFTSDVALTLDAHWGSSNRPLRELTNATQYVNMNPVN